MVRFVAALFAVAVVANAVTADVPPPPPPMGKKYVSVEHEVVLAKEVPGYVFVEVDLIGVGRPTIFRHKLKLPVGKPVAISVGGKYGSTLYAIPEAAAKEFKTDQELYEALDKDKVPGVHSIGFSSTATVPLLVIGKSVKWTHTITGIDEKGIKTKVEGEGYEPPAEKPEKKDKPLAHGGLCASVSAATLALFFGGLWLARRRRRETNTTPKSASGEIPSED